MLTWIRVPPNEILLPSTALLFSPAAATGCSVALTAGDMLRKPAEALLRFVTIAPVDLLLVGRRRVGQLFHAVVGSLSSACVESGVLLHGYDKTVLLPAAGRCCVIQSRSCGCRAAFRFLPWAPPTSLTCASSLLRRCVYPSHFLLSMSSSLFSHTSPGPTPPPSFLLRPTPGRIGSHVIASWAAANLARPGLDRICIVYAMDVPDAQAKRAQGELAQALEVLKQAGFPHRDESTGEGVAGGGGVGGGARVRMLLAPEADPRDALLDHLAADTSDVLVMASRRVGKALRHETVGARHQQHSKPSLGCHFCGGGRLHFGAGRACASPSKVIARRRQKTEDEKRWGQVSPTVMHRRLWG